MCRSESVAPSTHNFPWLELRLLVSTACPDSPSPETAMALHRRTTSAAYSASVSVVVAIWRGAVGPAELAASPTSLIVVEDWIPG